MSADDTAFTCLETPLWFPAEFKLDAIQPCLSCTLRLTSTVAGPGNVSPRIDGLLINENPLTTLTINGIQHTLLETVLSFPGGHRLLGRQSPCNAELFLYFRSIKHLSEVACLAVPLDVGAGPANKYFETLDIGVVKNRPSVGTVVPADTKLVMYRGADLRGRSKEDSNPRTFCDPIKSFVTYYVCLTPAQISSGDIRRLQERAGGSRKGPALPTSPPVLDRMRRICSLVDKIVVETSVVVPGRKSAPNEYDMNAMKCYRLNPEKDIKDGRIYVGGTPDTSLKSELERGAEIGVAEKIDTSIQPGDIEKAVGIALGIFVGIVVCAAIAYYIWKNTFRNYVEAQHLYNSVTDAENIKNAAVSMAGVTGWLSSWWKPSAPPTCPALPPASAPSVSTASVKTSDPSVISLIS